MYTNSVLIMNNINFSKLRKQMIDTQIRPNKVIDEEIIRAFNKVPKELFVSKALQEIAYIDEDVQLSSGRHIMEAMVMSRLIQSLKLKKSDNVLIIGAATGYSAAIFSHLVTSVIAIETRANLVEKAQQNVVDLEIGNVAVIKNRLQDGFEAEAPYDIIFIDGAIQNLPQNLSKQLVDQGKLGSIFRSADTNVGEASIWFPSNGGFIRKSLFSAQVPVLEEFKSKSKFVF